MTKTYLSKIFLIVVILCQFYTKAKAQYAIGGTAGANLYNSVYWLTWDATASGSTLISAPAGANASNITNGTYIWQFSPTVRITAVISNEVFVGGVSPNMTSYTPGNYVGDGLDLIYSGNNQPKPFSRGVDNSGLAAPYGGQVTFNIDVKVAILINGVYTDVVYPGMVIADAESIDSGGEYISGDTPNPIAWQLLNKRTEGNAADDHYKMDLSNGGRSFKLYADLAPGNFGVQAVMFAHGARELQNVSMKGSGLTAMAIGFVLPFDLGDEPSTYGTAGHYMDQFQITDYYPGDGTYAVVNYNTTPLVAKASVYIGANNVDPDGQPVGTALANNDDLIGASDESTFNVAALPDIKVNQAGNITLNVPVTNTKGVPATLYGWIDFNRDGVFSNDEVVTATIPANTNNQTFTLTFLNATFASKIKTGVLYTRFRITTTPLIDDPATPNVDERSFSFAADGEAEDYKFKDILGVNISGFVYDDHNGGNDATISGTGIQYVGPLQLFAYLIDNTNTIVNKATVQADGSYSLLNSNNGTYLVVISTNDVALGGSITGVQPNLPPSWKPSGEAYGLNNAGHTGVEAGTPNLQIQVATPGTSLDVTGVNFGLNQVPITANDAVTTNINTPILIDAPGNDYDPDGTADLTSVLLIDPADNVKKKIVTIAGTGTFSVNAINGQVTFTPVATFTGKANIFYTMKDDYGSESLNTQITVSVKPVGANDVDQTAAGTPVTTIVKANDGASGTGNTVTAGTPPAHGTITINASGTVTYTPTAGYIGNDTYTYILVTPDGVSSDPITVTITVGAPKPIGADDADITPINTAVTTTVTANDPGATGSTLAVVTGPAHGTAVIGPGTGQITYTPAAGFMGKDTYTYTLTKAGIVSDPITVTISVKPVGVNDADQTPINTPVTTSVKTNDGASGTGTTVTAGTAPLHGSIVVNASGTITYTPNAGYSGTDTYTYTLNTADGVVSDPITVTITVNPKPVGADDAGVTPINTAISLTVTANDPSATGSTIAVATVPAHGTAVVGPGAGQITYTPAAGFMGNDTYTYTLTNAGVLSDPITVTISVKPVGVNDADQTPLNTPITTVVKANDGASGTGTTVTAGTAPLHGSIVVNASGTITYTPTTGYTGTDTYTYTLTTADGVMSDPITVTITVIAKPTGVNDAGTTPINTPIAITVTANDPSAAGSTINVATTPAHGTAVVGPGAGVITYTPAAGFIGKDTYTYTLTNSGVLSDPITVTISVKPVGANDADQTSVNTPVTTVVKANDGASGTGTTVTAGTAPLHGSIVVNASGTITYTPTAGYTGTDTYTYTLTTPDGVISDPITVTITVTTKPVGSPDAGTTPINTPIGITVTANDASAAGSTIAVATSPAHGTSVVGPGAGVITYTPAAGFVGKDTYTYTLTNGGIVSDPITVTISVKPVGSPDADQTAVNTPVTTTVTANDGPSGTGTTVTAGTAPLHGSIVVNPPGTITYTPTAGYTGTDTYTYTLTTADGVISDPITVTITVTTKPVGSPDTGTTPINAPIGITVTANDASAAGSTIAVATAPAHGSAVVGPGAGVITYTPITGFVGKDTYTYTLTNGGIVSDPITVTISVKPVGSPDADQTVVNTPVTTTVTANDGVSGTGTTVTAGTAPLHGSIVVNASGTITYTPLAGYTGTDTYTYTLTTADGVISDPITVTITVTAKPVGTDDVGTTPNNTAITTNVTANDPSAAGSTVAVLAAPAHGTVVLGPGAGQITYTPAAGFTGKDTYTYTLTNGGIVSDPIKVTISVKPVGVNDVDQTPVNIPVTTTVKANDGASGTGTTVTAGTVPTHGSIVVNASGTITYTPNAGYIGTDTYTYTLTTADGVVSDPITVTITINNKPVGTPDAGTTPINTPIAITVTTNDASAAGSTVAIASAPSHGTVAIGPGAGVITYTPAAGFVGKDTYTYTLNNGGILSDPITVTISVKPVGVDDADQTPVNTPVIVVVKANDGPSGTGTTVTAATTPAHGSIVVNASGSITYTPNAGYVGVDTYTYTLTTADGVVSDPITVTITVYTASMTLTKVANNTVSKVGDVINYTMIVYNTGTSPLTNVVVADAGADAGSITPASITNLAAGALATVTAKHTVTQADVDAGFYSNQASVSALDMKGNSVIKAKSDNPLTISTDDATVTVIGSTTPVTPALKAIKIPTLFTPNGDGINDVFEIRGLSDYAQNELNIVNRWGNEVYKQTDYKNTWTGDGLNEGTYYYVLKLKAVGGTDWIVYKGYITLIRTFKK